MTRCIASTLRAVTESLVGVAGASARIEAERLVCEILDKPRSYLYAWSDANLSKTQQDRLNTLLARRKQGEPLAYILGHKEFWSLPLKVTRDTLIPRPETELLVEAALQQIPLDIPLRIADLGTGSGAIALAIASERPLTQLFATDSNALALQVAKENAANLNLKNLRFFQGCWLQPLATLPPFDLIVSNPPYVADADPHLQKNGLPWEPIQALTSGPDGLADIQAIIRDAKKHLKPGAQLILEHGFDQARDVCKCFTMEGYKEVNTAQDLEGRDRISMGRMPKN